MWKIICFWCRMDDIYVCLCFFGYCIVFCLGVRIWLCCCCCLWVGVDMYVFCFFRKLCELLYLEFVDWVRWYVFWVDECVVKKDYFDSNYKFVWDGFLLKVILLWINYIFYIFIFCLLVVLFIGVWG